MMTAPITRPTRGALDAIMRDGEVETVYQPVVDLDSSDVVGYEALSRGPEGPLRAPDALFAAARGAGRLTELDWQCRDAAVTRARHAGVRMPLSLLINAEPETLLASREDASRWGRYADLRCFLELTERALAADPGRLVAAVDQVRAQDWGVALDDVGVQPASLALLPLIDPDVIKLDASLLRPPTTPAGVDVGEVVHAVLTHAARTGATVVAEGIETAEHLDLARGYGVAYGQGHLLGRPGPLPDPLPTPRRTMPVLPRMLDRIVDPGPFALLVDHGPVRALTPAAVVELGRQLLERARTLVPGPAVLVCTPGPLPDAWRVLLDELAADEARTPVLGVVGHRQPGVVTTPLAPDDPAGRDLAVAVVTAHFAAALAARPQPARRDRYDAGLTLDRATAVAIANSLLRRVD